MSEFEKKVDAFGNASKQYAGYPELHEAKQALLDEHARVKQSKDDSIAYWIEMSKTIQGELTVMMKERDELKSAIRACVPFGFCQFCQAKRNGVTGEFDHAENCIWTRCQAEESK